MLVTAGYYFTRKDLCFFSYRVQINHACSTCTLFENSAYVFKSWTSLFVGGLPVLNILNNHTHSSLFVGAGGGGMFEDFLPRSKISE
jgi:hypothetical protein